MSKNIDYDTPAYWRKYGKDIVPDDLTHIERGVVNGTISTYDQHNKRNPLAVLLGAVIAVAAIVALISAAASAAAR